MESSKTPKNARAPGFFAHAFSYLSIYLPPLDPTLGMYQLQVNLPGKKNPPTVSFLFPTKPPPMVFLGLGAPRAIASTCFSQARIQST